MSTRPNYVQRMPWLPSVRHGCPPPLENFTPAPNGIVTSLLSPDDRASLRAMNVKLTEQAIQQCGALVGIRNQVDYGSQYDVFRFAQSIPLSKDETLNELERSLLLNEP